MKILVNDTVYECSTAARTLIKYWQRNGASFHEQWMKKCNNSEDKRELLIRLVYSGLKDVPFEKFKADAEADDTFVTSALAIKGLVFACNLKPSKPSPDYGIPNDEVTFLANFAIHGLPDAWLDEFTYYQIIEIIQRKALIQNPDTYKIEIATSDEVEALQGLTEKKKKQISEYLRKTQALTQKGEV